MTTLFLVYICLFIFALYKYDYILNKVGPTAIGQAHGTFFRKLLLPIQSQSISPVEADWFHLIPLEPVDEVGCFSLLFPGGEIHTWLGSSSAAHNDEISLVAMSVEFIKSNIDPLVPSGLKYQDEKRALNSRIKHCQRDIDRVQGVFFTDPP